jgi:hypothetical protein
MASNLDQLAAMDATALVAELRALNSAGGTSSAVHTAEISCCALLCAASPMPTGAAAVDAVRAVVDALTRGVQDSVLQATACTALAKLLPAAPAASANAAGIKAVVAALRAHPGDAYVQCTACAALKELLALNASHRATAGAAGGIAAVVAALTRHPADLKVAFQACDALSCLTYQHPSNAAAALDADAVKAATAAMRAFPAAAHVQLAGCCALLHIANAAGNRRFGGERSAGAAADAVVAAMKMHASERTLQSHGCDALIIIFHEEQADAAWVRRGAAGLSVITAAMRAYREDVNVLCVGCVALSYLTVSVQATKRAAGISDAISAVVAALRAFPAVAGLQQHGLGALSNICRNERDNQLAAAAAGGLEVTISALRTHAANPHVQLMCFGAMGVLVTTMPPNQTRAGALGGVEVMVAALRACAAVPLAAERIMLFEQWALTILLLMLKHPINTDKAVAAGIIEASLAHLCAPDAVSSVFAMACTLMTCLVSDTGPTGHEARLITAGALEALEARRAESPRTETLRLKHVRNLQPAAQRHDAAPCAVMGCKRCAAARAHGDMCALPGCGARDRDGGGAKKLPRCGTCRTVCYCGAAHQREDWRRHKRECGAPPRDNTQAGGGAS